MLRSLFSGVSGLRNHQIRLDVIGNNIANVNTIGFKESRCNFRDVLYQTVSGASSPQGGRGGINPKQVGLGVSVGSIDAVMTQGNIESTGRNTDLAIEGDGFFILGDDNGIQYYTRAGAFSLDTEGNLINAGNGLKVVGWTPTGGAGALDPDNALPGFIQIKRGEEMPPSATTAVDYIGNLDSRASVGDTRTAQKTIYDSLGNTHELTITFTKTNDNEWSWTASTSDPSITVDDGSGVPATGSIYFTTGGAFSSTNPATSTVHLTGIAGADDISMTLDFTSLTQYGSAATANAGEQNGYSRGSLNEFSVDNSGVITGYYSNGRSRALAQVALAVFNNPEGLMRSGDTLFQASNNSGSAQVGTALSGGRGTIKPGSLEMSNVDLSQEFTNLIITQRGFQASSRVITSSDEMLQELVNLKR
ncbi:MAG: flagellar hook protein FlgE [Chitinophagales bacterium]